VTELFFDERPREPRVISYLSRGIVAYHKSGITLSSKLVGDSEAGPLSRLVLDSAGDFRVPQDLKLVDYGEHQSPRGGRPVITPYFQAFLRTFADNNGPGMFLHFSNPLKSRKPQLQDLMADDGGGLVLHLVRRPSDMIVSGYRYHGQQRREGEEWLHFSSPPDCLSCDHQAWAQIFGRCAFRCSYYQLLQNLSSVEGLQMEYLRSRCLAAANGELPSGLQRHAALHGAVLSAGTWVTWVTWDGRSRRSRRIAGRESAAICGRIAGRLTQIHGILPRSFGKRGDLPLSQWNCNATEIDKSGAFSYILKGGKGVLESSIEADQRLETVHSFCRSYL